MKPKEEIPLCEKCHNPIDDCTCACPYCGKTSDCDCCLNGAVTGG